LHPTTSPITRKPDDLKQSSNGRGALDGEGVVSWKSCVIMRGKRCHTSVSQLAAKYQKFLCKDDYIKTEMIKKRKTLKRGHIK
jgi:hypothetical protein